MKETQVSKKTIWIINQYGSLPSTGTGGRHRHLARELAKIGHNVSVISARWTHGVRDTEAAFSAPEVEEFEGFRFVRILVKKYDHAYDKKRILNWFIFAWRLRRLGNILEEKPDSILYSSPSLIGFLGAEKLAHKNRARLLFEVRDIWPLTLQEIGGYSSRHWFIRFLQWIEDRAYQKSDHVLSNLPGAVDHMVTRGMRPEKFTWIPNGFSQNDIDTTQLLPTSIAEKLPKDTFNVAYTGTHGTANALHTLLQAAHILRDTPQITFTLVGKGKEKENLRSHSEELDLNNVYFLDPVPKDQVQSILERCSACYIGLTRDSLFRFGVSPNKLFDYLISGKPIIYAIDSGDYRPIEEFNAGIQVEPGSPHDLARAIYELYQTSSEERHQMGANGRNAALKCHEYGNLAKQLDRVL